MTSQQTSRAARDYSVLTVSTGSSQVPLIYDYRHANSLRCSATEMGYSAVAVDPGHSHHSVKPSLTDHLTRVDNDVLDIGNGPPSGDSSGFEGSACLLETIGTDPSPAISTSSSPGLESPTFSSSSVCSPVDQSPKAVPSSAGDAQCCSKSNAPTPTYSSSGHRHRSLPIDTTITNRYPMTISDHPRRQSSPGSSSSRSTDPRTTSLISSFNKMNLRARCRTSGTVQSTPDSHNRSLPSTVHPVSALEPIPQGQELSVNTHLAPTHSSTVSPAVGPSSSNSCQSAQADSVPTSDSGMGSVGAGADSSGSLENRKLHPCCSCRVEDSATVTTTNDRPCVMGSMPQSDEIISTAVSSKNGPTPRLHNSHDVAPSSLDSSFHHSSDLSNRFDRQIPGTHWAKELIGRLRSNSIHHHQPHSSATSTEHSESLRARQHQRHRRHSAPRDTDAIDKLAAHTHESIRDPDSIDPRRLPKTHGPTSASLQFAKKPLHHPTLSSGSTPIPLAMSPGHQIASTTASSALKSSSWRSRKHIGKVRWLSQDNDDDVSSGVLESLGGSVQARLSSSAVEEFRGAVDILAVRCQPFATNNTNVRAGIRVKRASESERLLVISRSLSDSKEEFSTCSFGHFDEDHVYGTLFRHSTCYDVLPDSGKLIILDSKLGVVRAIRALLENGVQAAPIWHSATQRVTGLFSQDFALHLLSSLYHYQSGTERESSTTPSECTTMECGNTVQCESADPLKSQSVSVAHGLRVWGSRRLSDILRLFHCADHDRSRPEFADSALIVSPQMGLHKALCRLVHRNHIYHSQRHRSKSGAHHPRSCHISTPRSTGQTNNNNNGKSNCQDSMDIFEWETFSSTPGAPSTDTKLSSSHGVVRQFQSGNSSLGRQRHSSDPYGTGTFKGQSCVQSVDSPSSCVSSTGSHTITYSPTHLIVMNPECGNVLGLLGLDRLLAYLRLRSDELPSSNQMMSPVGCLPCLRWTERCAVQSPDPAEVSNDVDSDTTQLPNPVISPQTPCYEAIHTLDLWLPQLPSLPVIQSNSLLGFITSSDLLHFVLGPSPDVAVDQPVSKILEGKMQHCRFQQDCVCYAQEPVSTVLDRMFRLKVSYLLLLDSPKHCASSSPIPVGMVTAKDLLMAIVTIDHHHHYHHHSHNDQKEQQYNSRRATEPMLVDGDVEVEPDEQMDNDDQESVDSRARAMGLTRSQHERLQQTHSDMLLGLSHTCSLSLSPSPSPASGSTYSVSCCSDSEPEPEQEVDASKEDVTNSRHTRHRISSTSTDKCNCTCHHQSSSPGSVPCAPVTNIRPHGKLDTDQPDVTSQSAHSQSMKRSALGVQNKQGQQSTRLPDADTFLESHSLKPSTWTQRYPPVSSGAMPPPSQPPTIASASHKSSRVTIMGPATALETAFNTRLRRSEVDGRKKVCKRDDDESVFRMD